MSSSQATQSTQTDYTWVYSSKPVKSAFYGVCSRKLVKQGEHNNPNPNKISTTHKTKHLYRVVMSFDGASRGNPGKAGCGAVAYLEKQVSNENFVKASIMSMVKPIENTTNNMAEWKALVYGLETLVNQLFDYHISPHEVDLVIRGDSNLVIQQLLGNWKIKDKKFQSWYERAFIYLNQYGSWSATHVYRTHNQEADRLANEAIDQ